MDGNKMAVLNTAEISWSEVGFRFPPRSNGNRTSRGIGWIDPSRAILLGLLCSQTALDNKSGRSGVQGDDDGHGYKNRKGDSEIRRRWTN